MSVCGSAGSDGIRSEIEKKNNYHKSVHRLDFPKLQLEVYFKYQVKGYNYHTTTFNTIIKS